MGCPVQPGGLAARERRGLLGEEKRYAEERKGAQGALYTPKSAGGS